MRTPWVFAMPSYAVLILVALTAALASPAGGLVAEGYHYQQSTALALAAGFATIFALVHN